MRERETRKDDKFGMMFHIHHPEDEAWKDRANCAGTDPNVFFPPRGTQRSEIKEIAKICDSCVVQQDCLNYALKHRISHGIFGGLSERERRLIRGQIHRGEIQPPWVA